MRPRIAQRPVGPVNAIGRWRPMIKMAAGLAFLNILLHAGAAATGFSWIGLLQPSPELTVLAAGMGLLVRHGMPFCPARYAPIAAAILFVAIFRGADAFMSAIFSRPLNLAMDVRRLPDLVFLLWTLLTPARAALVVAGAALAAAAAGWGVWRSLRTLHAAVAGLGPSPGFKRLAVMAALIGLLGTVHQEIPLLAAPTLPRLAGELRFMLDLDGIRRRDLAAIDAARERARTAPSDLSRLGRSSVFFFMVESYGRTVFSNPNHSSRILPVIRDVEETLQAAGFEICSGFLAAPTSGGGSWLTHATLASGLRAGTQIRHDMILASDLTPLAEMFNRAGYRTVRAMPGTLWPWPEGEFYRYQRTVIAPEFGYRGPRFAWATMPDQFVLDWVWRNEIQPASQPLFVEFILVGSHADFEVQAPYVHDWQQIGDGSLFQTLAPRVLPGAWLDPHRLSEAYSAAIIYEWRVLSEFIRTRLPADELVIVMGDHQPPGPVADPDRSAAVPLHVISRSAEALARFIERGCTPGLIPDQPPPHRGIEAFYWDFLEDFSRGGERRSK